ncbi:MAG: molybdate ABC transporter permease subunit [Geminicoccaceae bacterium]
MDWQALRLSLELALVTTLLLAPVSLFCGRALAFGRFRGRGLVESLVLLPLVMPPTVLGFYLLVGFAPASPLGSLWQALSGDTLAFSFSGLVLASVIVNLPFAIQPAQRAFEAIPRDVREAARCCGMSSAEVIRRIELPLAWPGILTGLVMSFAHTLGEFGVVLMVGGSIPGETRTLAIAIYDRTQAMDHGSAAAMAAMLMTISIFTVSVAFFLSQRVGRRHG